MGVNLLVFISVPGTQFHDVNGLICPVGAAAGPLCQIQNTRYIRRMQAIAKGHGLDKDEMYF